MVQGRGQGICCSVDQGPHLHNANRVIRRHCFASQTNFMSMQTIFSRVYDGNVCGLRPPKQYLLWQAYGRVSWRCRKRWLLGEGVLPPCRQCRSRCKVRIWPISPTRSTNMHVDGMMKQTPKPL